MKAEKKGHVVVLSGPSGAGKSTVFRALKELRPTVELNVSHTSRKPREGEVDGVHYHFISADAFRQMIDEGAFLEHTCYQGNYYGTSLAAINSLREAGKDVILDIEVEGAANVRRLIADVVEIFVTPPSFEELSRRLYGRGTESREVVEGRLKRAREELKCIPSYDYLVINDEVEAAAQRIAAILNAADVTVSAQPGLVAALMND